MPKRPTLRERVSAPADTDQARGWEAAYAPAAPPSRDRRPAKRDDRLHEAVAAATFAAADRPDGDDGREPIRRVAEGTRAVARAQAELVAEWLLTPLWATGVTSPAALPERYRRLADAYRELAQAYYGAAAWPGTFGR